MPEREKARRLLYFQQLEGLYARYRISEQEYLTYVLPHISEASMFDISAAEREIRRFTRGLVR